MRNLYQVGLDDEIFFALAESQSDALKIVFDKEVNNHNDIEYTNVSIVCSENDIINLITK